MPADDLALLADAARAAGEIAKRHFGNGPECWTKPEDGSPVTEADLEIDEMLRHELLAARPDYGWLSEETADRPDRLSRQRVFIVDPIDGTRAFVAGETGFSHALAVIEDGQPIAAAVALPMRDEIFLAAKGKGATLNEEPISPSEKEELDGATVLGAKASFAPKLWRRGLPEVTPAFRSSLAWRLSLVAQGRFDAMITLRKAWEWDIAAGALLVEEAGGVATDRKGRSLRFNSAAPRLDGVIAGGRRVQGALLDRLA
ncbi:MAG: 3'(2'),5'-bisphosphate nucleotidase CysQ [Pseudomonadota bacterium]